MGNVRAFLERIQKTMSYTFKKDEASESELLPEGDYEVSLEKAEFKESPTSRRKKIGLMFRVRSDVEQSCKNRVLFDDIWTDKETNSIYDNKKINRIMGTQDIPDGKEWKTIQDVVNDMVGIYLIAHVAIKHDDYNKKDVNAITYYKETKHKAQTLPNSGNLTALDIDEDDIPF